MTKRSCAVLAVLAVATAGLGQGPGDRSDRDPPGRAGSAVRHIRRHSRGRRGQGRREDAGGPGEGDGALDQAVPDAVPQGQRARPQHQGAAGGLVRQRRLPEGRGQPRRRVDQARGARQGRRRRRAWRRRSRSWGMPARRATRTIAPAEQRPAPRPDPGITADPGSGDGDYPARTSLPGVAPVYCPRSNTGVPDTSVAM